MLVFILDLLAFKRGQTAQLHVEDGRPATRSLQLELGAAADDLAAVADPGSQRGLERQDARLAIDQGQHLHAERALQGRVFEKLVEHFARLRPALEFDHDGHAAPVGLVAQVGDHVNPVFAHQFGDTLDDGGLVDLEGNFGDDDAVTVAGHWLDGGACPHHDPPLAGGVGVDDPLTAHDDAASREIRSLDELHQIVNSDVAQVFINSFPVRGYHAVNHETDGTGDLGEIVGWDVGRHADGDARDAIQQQVWHAGRQHVRFLERAIKVIYPVNGILVNVGQQFLGEGGQPRLGVAHGRRAVAVNRAEIALPIHQGVAHGEVLGHAGHGVVNRAVTVRMVFAQHFADDTGALLIGLVRPQAHVIHGVQDAAMHRLEAVAGIE